MIAYIDRNRHRYGVEPICRMLPIAPSTYYQHTKGPRSARAVRDAQLKVESAGSTASTLASTAPARSGDSCTVRGLRWLVARWSG
jgi:putative transposase